jgi:hypothetical protein
MNALTKSAIALALLVGAASSVNAWTYTTSAPYGSYQFGIWTVEQNEWGSTALAWLNVNNQGNFGCSVNFTGGGVKNYCNAHAYPNKAIGGSVSSSYNQSVPGSGVYDFMWDLWTAGQKDELMVYTRWTTPTGGWGTKIASNVNIGGTTYSQIWQVQNGHNILMFFPSSQSNSGTRNLGEVLKWAKNKGKLTNSTFYEYAYGVEVTSTSGWANFVVNSHSASW